MLKHKQSGHCERPSRVKAIFDNDKLASELASSYGELRKRHYAVRTKYLIYLLTKDIFD